MSQDILTDDELRQLEDGTLGGYLESHGRPPAFRGRDGHPYTVSVEMEQVGDLDRPYAGFLVFPRFALSGIGVVGHVETPFLWRGASPEDIHRQAEALTLRELSELLEDALRKREPEGSGADGTT